MSLRALVIGAGPAGLAAAAQLAGWCASVTVAEARPRGALRQAGEHLPPAGLRALAAAGLGALLEDPAHGRSAGVLSCWDGATPAGRPYFFTAPGHGLNLDRGVFDASLAAHAETRGVRLLYGTRLAGLSGGPAGPYTARLRSPGTETLEADLIIDASGRQARAARLLGGRIRHGAPLVAIAGRLRGAAGADDGTLRIEACREGWWYGVALADGTRICTLATDSQRLRGHPGGARALWSAALARSPMLAPLTDGAVADGRVQVFAAGPQVLTGPGHSHALAVGDAAAAYDPLSSWGIAKGITDGQAAARALQRQAMGSGSAVAAHRAATLRTALRHWDQRGQVYAAETRWPQAPFWQAHGAAAPSSSAERI